MERGNRNHFIGFVCCVIIVFSSLQTNLFADSRVSQNAIASAHPLATQAGLEILEAGGNAFDAAIAVTAALAVVEPYGSGLGGGGFWLLHRESDQKQVMIDGREKAPLNAHRDMYLDDNGEVIKRLSLDGPLAAGIPGVPAAIAHLAQHYGKLPLSHSLKPAIRYAREGVIVNQIYRRLMKFRFKAIKNSPAAAEIFLENHELPSETFRLIQHDLVELLENLAQKGAKYFYQGEYAHKLVEGVQQAGGIWTLKDLAEYSIVERPPIIGHYKGWRIVSAAPPSSGGVVMTTTLNILSQFPYETLDRGQRVHLVVEAMRRAYRDRAIYLGDSDFVDIPLERITHPYYASGLASTLRLEKATPSKHLSGLFEEGPKGQDTTHFSVLDREGNRIAATLSINFPFGSGFVPPGTGLLLNDEMDDFAIKKGVGNGYGLVGAEANAIEPGKRMLSSMTPTFVESDEGVAILGTPGGSRIISMVTLATLELIHSSRDPDDWVKLPRFHHQFLPDAIQFEPEAFDEQTQQRLKALGHQLSPRKRRYGNMHAIYWDKKANSVKAASDPRGEGHAIVR